MRKLGEGARRSPTLNATKVWLGDWKTAPGGPMQQHIDALAGLSRTGRNRPGRGRRDNALVPPPALPAEGAPGGGSSSSSSSAIPEGPAADDPAAQIAMLNEIDAAPRDLEGSAYRRIKAHGGFAAREALAKKVAEGINV